MRKPATPPTLQTIWKRMGQSQEKLAAMLQYPGGGVVGGSYDHWDKVRLRKPVAPLNAEESWAAIKTKRTSARRLLPFHDNHGDRFHFVQIGSAERALHEIDSNARGLIGVPGAAATPETRDIYLQKSLLEEPFSSSVLEGAATTREIARKMIEEGRRPKTTGELMVLNNYRAMSFIRGHFQEDLTPAVVLELHKILTEGTLDLPEKVGVLRSDTDDVRVEEPVTDETLHTPPPAKELPQRLKALCDFANEPTSETGAFLHPVIRAIVLHFMLAYDHPFWDGNGRCARALFYWCVLRHGYWLLEYVSISSAIRKALNQYGMAFLFTETDEGDVTYFIQNQLKVIEQSLVDLREYLIARSRELDELGRALGALEKIINRRQLAVIQYILDRPSARLTIDQHEKLHAVSYLTARSDLETLARMKLLEKSKEGVKSVFKAPGNLKERLRRWKTPGKK